MSLITPDFGLIFWMTLIFGIVFFILAKFGFPMITKMVDERSDRINASIAKAKEAEESLASLAEEHRRMLAQAAQEQARILKETSEMREKILSDARTESEVQAAAIIAHAKEQIELEKEAAVREIRGQVSRLSVDVAEKVLRKTLEDNGEQKALLSRYFDEARGIKLDN